MKTVKNFMMLTAIALIMGAVIIGTSSGQSTTDYLKVKGKILNDHSSDIYLFEYDEVQNDWVKVKEREDKSSYNFRLATNKDYRIVFISDYGPIKKVQISAGKSGRYIEYIDIDFNKTNTRYAFLRQNDVGYYDMKARLEYLTANLCD